MDYQSLITAIDAEIAKLQKVRGLLARTGKIAALIQPVAKSATVKSGKAQKQKKRTLSPEARAKIAEAQRKRWAAVAKKAAK